MLGRFAITQSSDRNDDIAIEANRLNLLSPQNKQQISPFLVQVHRAGPAVQAESYSS